MKEDMSAVDLSTSFPSGTHILCLTALIIPIDSRQGDMKFNLAVDNVLQKRATKNGSFSSDGKHDDVRKCQERG